MTQYTVKFRRYIKFKKYFIFRLKFQKMLVEDDLSIATGPTYRRVDGRTIKFCLFIQVILKQKVC